MSHDYWLQALLQMPAPAAAELWHQQVLPREVPNHWWASAYAYGVLSFSIPRAGLGWAGPWAQHPQNPGTQTFSTLPCWPCLCPGLAFPCLSPISNVVTILRPFTAAADNVEYVPVEGVHLCLSSIRKHLAPLCRCDGTGPEGAPRFTDCGLWGKTPKTII